MFTKINPIDLTAELIQCKTVTPLDGGALKLLGSILKKEGFDCHLIDRGVVSNLFACGYLYYEILSLNIC